LVNTKYKDNSVVSFLYKGYGRGEGEKDNFLNFVFIL